MRRLVATFLVIVIGLGSSPVIVAAEKTAAQDAQANGQSTLGEVPFGSLPQEAQDMLVLIKHGGPFPYSRDGIIFRNRERLLPEKPRDYYHEYTVPTPGAKNRGGRRIIAGRNGEYYYTGNHYRSFEVIRE
jgi:ribonuclease T1